jgi:hypothetical protein
MVAFAIAADPVQPAAPIQPGRKTPGDPVTQKNSEDVLELLQGGNSDVFIVIFFVGSNAKDKDDLKAKIQNEIAKEHGWIRVTEVDLNNVNDYNKLLRVLKMEGEPKRGHSVPQVLVMSKGEGFVIRGPNIIEPQNPKTPKPQIFNSELKDGTMKGSLLLNWLSAEIFTNFILQFYFQLYFNISHFFTLEIQKQDAKII